MHTNQKAHIGDRTCSEVVHQPWTSDCFRRNHRAGYGEDRTLLQLAWLAGLVHNGSFLELGAFDGLSGSNTYALERCLGWGGMLLEGNSANAQQMKQNRAAPGNVLKCVRSDQAIASVILKKYRTVCPPA